MQTFNVEPESDGKSLIRVILNRYPALSIGTLRAALRKKDVRLNGQRLHADCQVFSGDQIAVYLADEWLSGKKSVSQHEMPAVKPYSCVYQDSLIILVSKKPGVTVQPAAEGKLHGKSLLELVRDEFKDSRIELCHRLDRLTGGLLLLARKPAALAAVQNLMREGMLVKRYRCLVRGVPAQGEPVICHDGTAMLELTGWLEKVASQSDVYIHDQKNPGDLPIITRYRVLRTFPDAGPDLEPVSELEVELVTGRTHQIRAHFAHIGHPVLGDGKYGRNSYNRFFKGHHGPLHGQQLYATTLIFRPDCQGTLAYLAGRTFSIEPEFDWLGTNQ